MYDHGQTAHNGLVTNLNSISSSLSSIDTIGQRRHNGANGQAQSNKTSVDNLISQRSTYVGTNSTGLLWNRQVAREDPYSLGTLRGAPSQGGSEIYYSRRKKSCLQCPNSVTATNFILVPLLLLTLLRQVFDFLGQIWLQIIINFFTIILIIVALFGIRQNRISYLLIFTVASLFNTFWNLVVIGIHFQSNDLSEDLLSLYTGATSWWHTNGPGCLPYTITNIQPSINIIKSNIKPGCKIDYHLIESTQAAVHSAFSLISVIFCCYVIVAIRRSPEYFIKKQPRADHSYRMNELTNNHNKNNQDPYANLTNPRIANNTNSLRRARQKASSRSSQHSVSSMRSARRRRPSATDTMNPSQPTPRALRSSMNRSSKYGSLSSRRSSRHRENGVNDVSSLTYGTTVAKRAIGMTQRSRLSSLSSTEYLPSYQPPHTSSANLLSSYGEISSIDSYNNPTNGVNRSLRAKNKSQQSKLKGNTNPVYQGSRSSVCSQNMNTDNYDDISYIYGGGASNGGGGGGASSVSENPYGPRASDRMRRSSNYQHKISNGGYSNSRQQAYANSSLPEEIRAETYQSKNTQDIPTNGESTTMGRNKPSQMNGTTFQSFSKSATNYNTEKFKSSQEPPTASAQEVNNNNMVTRDLNAYGTHNNNLGEDIDQRDTQLVEPRLVAENGHAQMNGHKNIHHYQVYANQRPEYGRYNPM